MAATLTITFSQEAVQDDTIDLTGNGLVLTFKNVRGTKFQVPVASDAITQAEEFTKVLYMDVNTQEQYTIEQDGDEVAITHQDNTHFDDFDDGTDNNTTGVTTSKDTTDQKTPISVTVTHSEFAPNPCDFVSTNLSFNQTISELRIYQRRSNNSDSEELYFNEDFDDTGITIAQVNRDFNNLLIFAFVKDGEGSTIEFLQLQQSIPQKLLITDLDIAYNALGGTVTITTTNVNGQQNTQYTIGQNGNYLEYQASNQFSGLISGNYTAKALDEFGCERSQTFTVLEIPTELSRVNLDYFVSTKNSLRGAYRNTADTANPFNFLLPEFPYQVPIKNWYQVYGEHQTITQQWKSSYPTHRVSIIDATCGASILAEEVEIDTRTITDNINRDNYLEGNVVFNSDFGRLAVWFDPGNVYDANGTTIGNHDFDGTLPTYYELGTLLTINNVATQITDFTTVGGIKYAITAISNNYTQDGIIIESLHRETEYEDVECDIVMSSMPSEFYVKKEFIKADNTVHRTYATDLVKVISKEELTQGKWHIIEYWNDISDSEINYKKDFRFNPGGKNTSGIKFTRNLPFTDPPSRVIDAEQQAEKLDNKYKKLDYSVNRVFELFIDKLPYEYAATTCDGMNESEYMNIDGMLCTTFGNAELERKGAWGFIKVKVAIIGLVNASGVINEQIQSFTDGYYVQTA